MNRRKFILTSTGLLVPATLLAIPPRSLVTILTRRKAASSGSGGGGGGAGTTYLVSEDFEGGSLPTGWSAGGSPTYGYTPALLGTASVRCGSASVTLTFDLVTTYPALMLHAVVSVGAIPASAASILRIMNASNASQSAMYFMDATGYFKLYCGSSVSTGNVDMSGSTKHVWLTYEQGSGNNAKAYAYISDTATKPVSPTLSITNGTSTDVASRIRLAGSSSAVVFDQARSAVSLGDIT